MKKRIISTLMTICIVIGMVPAITTEAAAIEVTDAVIEQRIEKLYKILGEGKKCFGVNPDSGCGTRSGSHGSCSNCYLPNIIKAGWFTEKFRGINTSQFLDGNSCQAFRKFATWYIHRADDKDTVNSLKQVTNGARLAFNYETAQRYARAGDYIYIEGGGRHHAAIVTGYDEKGIWVLDCNWVSDGEMNCLVKKHCIDYTSTYKCNFVKYYSQRNGQAAARKRYNSPVASKTEAPTTPPTTNTLAAIPAGTYTLTPACAPNSRLDIQGKSTSNGANAHIWKAYDDTSQIFSITAEGDGYYLITSEMSGKRLDVTNARTTSGTNVQQWSANNNDAQRWAFEDAGDGYYYIVSKLTSGLCLDVNRGGSADGTNVQVWSKNNTASQKWKLTPVEKKPKLVTITFDPNGGGGAEYSWTREVGGTYGPQPDIIWDGYTLDGWYTARQGGKKVLPLTKIDSEDEQITLYAHWTKEEPKLVSITVDFNGGDGAGVCWRREVGETYGSLPDATRDGYAFDGWYTSKRGGSRVSSSTRVDGEDEEITLYARWTKEEPEVPPTPRPAETPKVTPTPEPSKVPEVTPTPEPTETPEVTPTPEPTGHWGPWSDWSEKKANASNTRQVERREVEDTPAYTEYRYGKWGNPRTKQGHACKNLAQQYYGSVAELTTEWYSTRYSPEEDYKIFCGGKNHTHKGCFKQDGNDVWNRYIVDGVTYFWEESREVKATYKTQYRYRDWIEG